MKSWFLINDKDQGSFLEMRDVAKPTLHAGEVLIRVHAASLNRGEFLTSPVASSLRSEKQCGIECAGEVVEIGAGVDNIELTDRVMGRTTKAFSEYVVMTAGNIIKVPRQLSWEQAGAATITFMTAYDMLWPGGALQPNEWLMIAGVTSGVGVASLQLGKLIGANVIGTSRSPEKLEKLKLFSLDCGISFSDENFEKKMMEMTAGRGIDFVVNNVGGSVFSSCVRILAYQGRIATVGHVDGVTSAEFDLQTQHGKRLNFFGVSNKMRSAEEIEKSVKDFTRDVLPAFTDGRIVPFIDKVYSFGELPLALERMMSNRHLGNIVVTI